MSLWKALPSRELFAKPAEVLANETVSKISLYERKLSARSSFLGGLHLETSSSGNFSPQRSLSSNLRFKDILLCPPQYITARGGLVGKKKKRVGRRAHFHLQERVKFITIGPTLTFLSLISEHL